MSSLTIHYTPLQALRDVIVYCVLAICLIMTIGAANRERYNAHQAAIELRRVQDYTDSQVLQSRMAMLDIVTGLSTSTKLLTQITCLSSGAQCSDTTPEKPALLKYTPPNTTTENPPNAQ